MEWFLSSAFAVVLLSVGLFLFRESIKQWLSRDALRDIERLKGQLQSDHARYSAELQREVEAYKVSLIAEAERAKANQELKTALALRIAERRFESIATLHDASVGLASSLAVLATFNATDVGGHHAATWDRRSDDAVKRLDGLKLAVDRASPFLTSQQNSDFLRFQCAAVEVLSARTSFSGAALENGDTRLVSLARQSNTALDTCVTMLRSFDLE